MFNAKHAQLRSVRIEATSFQAVNTLPTLNASDDGMYRRLEVIDFLQKFPNDASWTDDILFDEKEWSGVLNMLLPRIMRIKSERKLEYPSDPEKIRELFEATAEHIGPFVLKCMQKLPHGSDDRDTPGHVYDVYKKHFCREMSMVPMTLERFIRLFKASGYRVDKYDASNEHADMERVVGCRLKDEYRKKIGISSPVQDAGDENVG